MNCELVNKTIEELTLADFTHGLDKTLDSSLKAHIDTCDECEQALQAHYSYVTKMAAIEIPAFSNEQANAMLSKVANSANKIDTTKPAKNDNGFLQGFIAASVLAVSIFGAWNLYSTSAVQQPTIVSTAPEYYTTEVVLIINAPEDMYDADLNIVLPQNIALEGYDNIQDLSWPVDLKAGANTLSLPIRVNKSQSLEQPLSIMAKLYHYADEREFEIKIDVEKMKSQQKNSALLAPTASKTHV